MRTTRAKWWKYRLGRFCQDEQGAEVVEWAIVTLLVVLGSYVALTELRDALGVAFTTILGRFFGDP